MLLRFGFCNSVLYIWAWSKLAVAPLCLHLQAAFYNLYFHFASFIMPKVPKETGKRKKVVLNI
ncbi:hypothetical protein E2C01_064863 [Portunus trituberculatus]|uniref:Uncharacterized protein n=1 Tax=Portunus trituberculatus TaxID=210409 RepID=A0A5B7HLH6_PORTR|nr:hypothetical protein [Portunus trituberculatus]